MSVLSFHWRRVWQLNTRLVHFQECSKSVQITFHLIHNEMFKDLFKRLLQSLQASTEVKRPRSQNRSSQNADSAVIFINPWPWNLYSQSWQISLELRFPPPVEVHSELFNLFGCFQPGTMRWRTLGCNLLEKSQDLKIARLLMSLKWLVFVRIPNSASCSQAKGRSPNSSSSPNQRISVHLRHWRRTMWQCRVEFLGNKKTSEVFQFKACVGTKDGNFVPNFG